MPTTFEAIRDNQISIIEALVPTKHSADRFRRHREGPFDAWVEKTPTGALRRFQILSNFDMEQGPTADGSIESCRHTMDLRIAYPLATGRYGQDNERDREDLMLADLHQIDAAIGLNGGPAYVTNQDLCQKQSHTVLDLEGVRVLSITYLVQFDRSV